MANIKTAKKRIKTNEKKAIRNKAVKSNVKTKIKNVELAITEGNKELATAKLIEATAAIDSACTRGLFHKNTAARRVSKLTRNVSAL